MAERHETWESFWAQALRIDFFKGQWEMYRKVADARAEWLEQTFGLSKERPLLSLACGEGGIELALARRGFQVTGIDNCIPFIQFAREEAAKENLSATFLTADLRHDGSLPDGNGTVVCFDTVGLMSQQDDEKLIKRMVGALAPGGTLLADCPAHESLKPGRTWWPVGNGHLLMETRFDKASRTQLLEPLFIEPDGGHVRLKDPYDESRGEHTGVQRYIYEPRELTELVSNTGLPAEPVKHQRGGYFMIYGNVALSESE